MKDKRYVLFIYQQKIPTYHKHFECNPPKIKIREEINLDLSCKSCNCKTSVILVNINVLVDEKFHVDVDNHLLMLLHNLPIHLYNMVSLEKITKQFIFK